MRKTHRPFKRTAFFLAVAVAVVAMGGRTSSAFTETDVEKVRATGSCEGCNLRHANLAGANLAKGNLSGADLGGANLRKVNLSGANLSGAKLADAVLTDADLTGANLTGASLAGAYMAGTDFSRAIWVDGKTCGSGSVGKCGK